MQERQDRQDSRFADAFRLVAKLPTHIAGACREMMADWPAIPRRREGGYSGVERCYNEDPSKMLSPKSIARSTCMSGER